MYWPYLTTRWELNPFRDLARLQREMNRFVRGWQQRSASYPAINVWANEEEAVVTAEIPGVDPKSLGVTVADTLLTLEGERKECGTVAEEAYQRRERGCGTFQRTVTLPFEVEGDQIKARYEKGILRVTLPRREATRPRKIAVTVEEKETKK